MNFTITKFVHDEAAECRYCIEKRINLAGYELDMSRGDNITWTRK